MEALVQELFTTQNDFVYNHHSKPVNQGKQRFNLVERSAGEGEEGPEGDYSDAILKYINQMLMEEEDLENQPCMFRDCMALHATEKYFSDVLNGSSGENSHVSITPSFAGSSPSTCSSDLNNGDSDLSPQFQSSSNGFPDSLFSHYASTGAAIGLPNDSNILNLSEGENSPSKGKRNHYYYSSSDNGSAETQRSNKHLASYAPADEPEPLEMYDDVLLCSKKKNSKTELQQRGQSKGGGRNRRGKKKESQKEFVDLSGLLTQCAQAMASYDTRTVTQLLKKIRDHSSPQGNGHERMAFYLANALEARLNGTGTALYISNSPSNISAADILKAYQMYITASPFKKVSNMFANRYIRKVAAGAPRLHIIDFGILYGFQWPCLIQGLSTRPGGPPRLRITGIDFPQPGFRPADRVKATGRRLDNYCKRFKVPFEFKAIAQKWDTIKLEDLEIDRDDVLVVNCLDRLGNVPDETVVPDSPRDIVLDLIRKINPDVFIHGVVNGTYNTPFFVTRFREALFHFSSLFDIFEATVPREDKDRQLFEEMLYGRDALNVIACEGSERVERPETYKQWQVRSLRAGFRQLPLDQEITNCVKDKVKSEYHKDFSIDEDGKWLLQGWKGRVLHAVSCWKPIN
ncbi:PREDICTED: scarecrow-like protein 30 [Ipomoea nil]|uniref:scarecrow-like protein 30 n=1 Tax=Ipomoea nil TaxID=35883 RepID=UPI0009010C67|nr:PREDICTED: scarecrow-like protein 30 [Ipomoea nil]